MPATATDLLIVQSRNLPAYDLAVQLLQKSCAVKNETLVMSDFAEIDLVRIVREEQPRLVIALGERAFEVARRLRDKPVVYSMTLNVEESSLGRNVTGVSMHVALENYLLLFRKLQLRRIGIIYNKLQSSAWLKRARKAANVSGTELITMEVNSPREVPAALTRLKDQSVDGLWMIPDTVAVTPENVDAYFQFGQQQNLPVISFARGYLKKGAMIVIEGSPTAINDQTCALIKKLRSGVPPATLSTIDIDKATLHTNKTVADMLDLNLSGLSQLFQSELQ